jgi:hypothetical protein
MALVGHWCAAKVNQLLTPAYQAAGVLWRKGHLTADDFDYLPVERRQVERAIEADEAFLTSHRAADWEPRRDGAPPSVQRSHASAHQGGGGIAQPRRDEFRLALGLRHRHIGEFCKADGVNLGWLLEGVGEMFKRGPKLAVDDGKEVQP